MHVSFFDSAIGNNEGLMEILGRGLYSRFLSTVYDLDEEKGLGGLYHELTYKATPKRKDILTKLGDAKMAELKSVYDKNPEARIGTRRIGKRDLGKLQQRKQMPLIPADTSEPTGPIADEDPGMFIQEPAVKKQKAEIGGSNPPGSPTGLRQSNWKKKEKREKPPKTMATRFGEGIGLIKPSEEDVEDIEQFGYAHPTFPRTKDESTEMYFGRWKQKLIGEYLIANPTANPMTAHTAFESSEEGKNFARLYNDVIKQSNIESSQPVRAQLRELPKVALEQKHSKVPYRSSRPEIPENPDDTAETRVVGNQRLFYKRIPNGFGGFRFEEEPYKKEALPQAIINPEILNRPSMSQPVVTEEKHANVGLSAAADIAGAAARQFMPGNAGIAAGTLADLFSKYMQPGSVTPQSSRQTQQPQPMLQPQSYTSSNLYPSNYAANLFAQKDPRAEPNNQVELLQRDKQNYLRFATMY